MRAADRTAFARAAAARFGRPLRFAARAPGRVNLIGEHTDYNAGLVLPCAIDRDTVVLAAPRSAGHARVWARDLDREAAFDPARPSRRGDFSDYVQGVCFALGERGVALPGFDLAIASAVPPESGLSSSAALGVAVATVLDAMLELGLDATARARLAHRGESHFVGVGCGILDQFASALGRPGHVLRIDCATEQVEAIPFPSEQVRLLVVHSGVHRALAPPDTAAVGSDTAEGGYMDRVGECEAALEAVRGCGDAFANIPHLSALAPDALAVLESSLPARAFRRVRHVVHENARVDAFVSALRACEGASAAASEAPLERLGALLRAGQASLRDDYEVSIAELDALCSIADAEPDCFGSRLTGAGFGGCTIHLVRRAGVDRVRAAIGAAFSERFGRVPVAHEMTPSAGAEALPGEALLQ